ncbi:TetR/AcrR family transcriptional regulator [Caulobacter sp. 17J80-11]|uniref:TetR/AcrR family transcriptional regulator n=1 Tax=Caulobacter sp. 17J80-11 TaxID=2763502 RepID=UPI002107ACF2|nr:TetR family transcriptional regulator [Caulobacter sp. 17J80-11]
MTTRYARRKDEVVAAATAVLNRKGVKGMTLAEVADSVGLITSGVTYYFRKKEDLAVACFLNAIERFDVLIAEAARGADPQARVRRFLELWLALQMDVRAGRAAPIANFSDMRALSPEHEAATLGPFNAMVHRLGDLMRTPDRDWSKRELNARANILLEQALWSEIWLNAYDPEDLPRVVERMFDVLAFGLAPAGATVEATPAPPPAETEDETFLIAATRLINAQGYRGASVERISASLNLTKGAFYHHNEAKDDLVVDCFARTYEVMRQEQHAASGPNGWARLCAAVSGLIAFQLSERGPLLRTSALTVVPEAIREQIVARSDRIGRRFAAMISDGIADGSIRPVDPVIAAQMLNASVNAVGELPRLAPNVTAEAAQSLYGIPVLTGLLRA